MGNKENILFSIIIPTYNRAHTLDRAIQSVLAQTYPHYELLVVDDGSTDNTEEVVKRITDERVRYFKKKNEERNIARNFGICSAQGSYVCFLDSDDYLLSHHLHTALDLILKVENPEVFHLGYKVENEQGQTLQENKNLSSNVSEVLIKENVLSCNAIFLRRNIAQEYQFIPSKDVITSEDWYVWLRLASRFPIHIDNTVTSVVVEHEQRSLRDINPDKLIKGTKIIIDHLQDDRSFGRKYGKQVARFYADKYTLISLVLSLLKNRRREVVYYLIKAFQYDWQVVGRKRFLASIKHIFIS